MNKVSNTSLVQEISNTPNDVSDDSSKERVKECLHRHNLGALWPAVENTYNSMVEDVEEDDYEPVRWTHAVISVFEEIEDTIELCAQEIHRMP